MILNIRYLPIISIALIAIRPFGINISLLIPLFFFAITASFVKFPKNAVFCIISLVIFTFASTFMRGWDIDSSHFVVLISFAVVFLLFYYIARNCNEEKTLALLYKFCFFSASFAILQQIDFILGLKALSSIHDWPGVVGGTDLTNIFGLQAIRVFGFATEPSHLGYILTPSIVLICERFIFKNEVIKINLFSALIITLAFVMTFSISAYVIFLAYIVFKVLFINDLSFKKLVLIFMLSSLIVGVVTKSDAVSSKVERLVSVESNNIYASSGTVLSFVSSLSILNYHRENNGIFLGVGLNNYRNIYDEYASIHLLPETINRIDSSSMLIRLMVELGIIPSLIILLFIVYKTILYRRSLVVLVFSFSIFGFMLRTGDYASPVFIFFVSHFLVYIKNYEHILSRKSNIGSSVLH